MRHPLTFLLPVLLILSACAPAPTATPVATRTQVLRAHPTDTRTRTPTVTRTFTPVPLSPVDQLLARCPTSREVAAINAELKLSFEADPTAGKLVCTAAGGSADLTLMQRRAYQTLAVMKQLRFTKPLPWTNQSLYQWFTDVIDGVRFRSDIENNSCCVGGMIHFKVAPNSYLMLTDHWVDAKYNGGLMDVVALLVHEARHAPVEGGKAHTCGANDKTIAEMGAYGVQYYFYIWLAEYGDANFLSDPLYRATARTQAEDLRRTRFCDEK